MKKFIIPVISFVIILAITGVFFFNQSKPLAAMADAQIPEQPLVIRYDNRIYEELIKELPEDYLNSDNDQDGISNKDEIDSGLSPHTEDSDNDGISDYEEINTYDSEPLKWSTADDGISDFVKITKHLSINSPIENYSPETITISDEIQLIPEDINSETLYVFSGYNGEAFKNLTPVIPAFRLYDFTGKVKIDLSAYQPKDVYVYFYNSLSGKAEKWNDVTIDTQQIVINFNKGLSGKPIIITKDSISEIKEWLKGLFLNTKKRALNNADENMDYQPRYISDSGFQIDKHSFSFGNMPLDCSPNGICAGFAFATNQIYNGMNPSRKMNKNTFSIPIIGEISTAPGFDVNPDEYDIIFEEKTPFNYKVTDNAISNYDSKGDPRVSYDTVILSDISQPDQEIIKCLNNYWLWSNKTTLYDSAVSALSNYKLNYEFSKIREIADLFKENQIIHVSLDGGIGGHAVNAYKLEQDKNDTDLFYLYIYDNNFPNNMMLFRNLDGSLRKQQTDIYMTIRRYPKKTLVGVYEMFDFSYGTGTYSWRNNDNEIPAGVRFYRSLEEMRLIEIEGTSHEYWERYTGISLEVPEQIEYDAEVPIKVIAADSLGIPREITKDLDCSIMIPNDLYSAGCLKDGSILYFDKKNIGASYQEFNVTANFRGLKANKTIRIGEKEDKPEAEITGTVEINDTPEYEEKEPLPTSQTTGNADVKIGDYIYFGQYLNEPILWRVVNLQEDGTPVLFSERVITYKAFDAAESGTYNNGSDHRQQYGSNNWEKSNLREWLNSNGQTVTYTTQAPTREAVLEGINTYDKEAGFLANFTQTEQNLIKPVTHKVILAESDLQGEDDGGNYIMQYITDYPSQAVTNEATAIFKYVTDKMYLLSIQEVAEWVEARGNEWKRARTQSSKDQSEDGNYYAYNLYGHYWLRTPSAHLGGSERIISEFALVDSTHVCNGKIGVVPAFNLNVNSAIFESGAGSFESPYVVKR